MATATSAFAAQVLRGRWFMAYGSFLIISAAGATYIFAIYSKDIKATLGYSQEQLNTVGFFKDVGANIGIHAGLVAEVTPPWLVLAVGAAMNLGGYLMLYLSVAGRVRPAPPLWLVCLYIASRGVMLGLLKGFVGLSGAIFTQLYLAFYGRGGDTKPLILLVGWLQAAVSVAFLGTIRIIRAPRPPAAARREYRAFCGFLYVSLALAAFLMVAIILQKRFRFTRAEYGVCAAVVLSMLLLPFAVVLREEAALFKKNTPEAQAAEDYTEPSRATVAATKTVPEPSPVTWKPATTAGARLLLAALRPPPRGEDYTILQALVSVDMLLLFTATVLGLGGTLTAIDNMGQIGESLGVPAAQHRDVRVPRQHLELPRPRRRWLRLRGPPGAPPPAAAAHPGGRAPAHRAGAPPHRVRRAGVAVRSVASVAIGFCFGAAQPLILASVSELFGLKYYSTLYNFCGTASPVGSYSLNVRVAGRMYDQEAARQGKGVTTCIGVRCYKESLVITAVTVAAGRGGGDGGAGVGDQGVLRGRHLRKVQGGNEQW
ncbi:hypothetical protein PVAP13_3NG261800 [Panicum virgatum]|uniref:Nodulin-like domain-containing protein n=1 Tax=Panicum virgatum TaxID=38727 RepID=A0A8T0UJA1_PANVG|nr:hypothetical protein PVAP13_3NG261800 [Panicum virgatum]